MLQSMCDGAIVGSALVKVIKTSENESPEQIAGKVEAFCRALLPEESLAGHER
jgi:tryptophan synthase alpha subunit